jgi:ribose 5-phosphate isomerase B
MKRIHVGSDHAGFELKEQIKAHLVGKGFEVIDHGAPIYNPDDDYPEPCFETGRHTAQDKGSLGIVFGGSGNGEQIAANKAKGVRAALVWNDSTAELCREHNDANIMSLGARETSLEDAIRFVDIFTSTPFSQGSRHKRRIKKVSEFEE